MSRPAPAEAPAVLTWQDCIRLAAQRNPDLLSALKAMEASRADYDGSYNGIFPQLNLTNSYTESSSSRSTLLTTGVAGTVTNQSKLWQAQGSASLDLIDLRQWATIRSAKAALKQSGANVQVASSNVLLNLYKAFAGTLYAQEQASVASEIHSIWKNNSELITLRYNSGRESKGNKMRTAAELLQAETDLAQASRDLRVAQQNLSQVLGEDHFKALAVTGTWTTGALPAEPPNLDALIEQEPRVLSQAAFVQQAQAAVQGARSSLFPTLSLNYSRGWQDTKEFPTSNPFWTFSGLLSYPLFGNGPTATYYASAAASRNLEKAQSDLRSLRNQVRSDLETAWWGYVQAQDQVRVQAAFLEAARQRRQESDIRYKSGLMSFEEWQLVIIDLVNFEKGYLRSQQGLLLAEAQWRFARGQQLGDQL